MKWQATEIRLGICISERIYYYLAWAMAWVSRVEAMSAPVACSIPSNPGEWFTSRIYFLFSGVIRISTPPMDILIDLKALMARVWDSLSRSKRRTEPPREKLARKSPFWGILSIQKV